MGALWIVVEVFISIDIAAWFPNCTGRWLAFHPSLEHITWAHGTRLLTPRKGGLIASCISSRKFCHCTRVTIHRLGWIDNFFSKWLSSVEPGILIVLVRRPAILLWESSRWIQAIGVYYTKRDEEGCEDTRWYVTRTFCKECVHGDPDDWEWIIYLTLHHEDNLGDVRLSGIVKNYVLYLVGQ